MKKYLQIIFLWVASFVVFTNVALSSDEFSEYEIRVIRPRYFSKNGKFELGLGLEAVLSETFSKTYGLNFNMGYYPNELFGIMAEYVNSTTQASGISQSLTSDFDIKVKYKELTTSEDILFVLSPAYGKFQIGGGKLIYLDTMIFLGGGVQGVKYVLDECSNSQVRSFNYPMELLGVGQRVYLSQSSALRWDLKVKIYSGSSNDGTCNGSAPGGSVGYVDEALMMGYGFFF